MSSADIRPVETSKRGVHVLKSYIEYAERGRSAPGAATGRDFDSPFENEVFKRLEARGYKVDVQVGVSNFRIDLGVRHPKQPSAYLCGVECDGAAFHKSRSARDRDCLREEVLKGLGWNLVRIWSTDWFADPDTATEKLVRQIRDLESKPLRDEKGVVFGMRASARADDNLDRGEPESRPMGDTRPEPRADAAARDGEKPRTQSDAQGAPGGRPAAQSPENRGGQDILVARQEPLRRPAINSAARSRRRTGISGRLRR
jgi:very-short-patch-repair endonuclease